MGEAHGVRENPEIIYTLMKKFNCRGLALEWDEPMQEVIDNFLTTGNLKNSELLKLLMHAGVISTDHFTLLKKLKDEGMLDSLVLFNRGIGDFDQSTGSGAEERDRRMAEALLANLQPDIPTLIMTGKFHSIIQETDGNGDLRAKKTMGFHLKKRYPTICSGSINYQQGQYYNFGFGEFPKSPEVTEKPTFTQDKDGNFIFNLPLAHPAIVPSEHA